MMADNKIVSIIIPVYNTEKYLKKCIESFLAQTYKDIEIVLVDDGSCDGSRKICKDYAEQNGRIKLVCQENSGVSCARNAGLDACSGGYICFADSDDYVEPDYIEYMLDLLVHNNADCSICLNFTEFEDGTVLSENPELEKITVFEADQIDFRDSSYVAVVTMKLYKAECLRANDQWIRFDSELKLAEDSYFAALAVPNLKKVVKTNRRLYYYVHHTNSATSTNRFSARIGELKSWYKIYELGKTLGERYEYSAKYELVSRCFRVHRATKPVTPQERKISREIIAYMRKNASYILREIGYPAKLKLVFIATLIFPRMTRGMNS